MRAEEGVNMSIDYIMKQIEEVRSIMVAVATGGPKIDLVNVNLISIVSGHLHP